MTVINTNTSALTAQAGQRTAQMGLSMAMERLSTGPRINSAKDDAAGLAISQRMTADVRGLSVMASIALGAACLALGCASGTSGEPEDTGPRFDANRDGGVTDANVDAPSIDANRDAPPIDAAGNPRFDFAGAVSLGVEPCLARCAEISVNWSRTSSNARPSMLSKPPVCVAAGSSARN